MVASLLVVACGEDGEGASDPAGEAGDTSGNGTAGASGSGSPGGSGGEATGSSTGSGPGGSSGSSSPDDSSGGADRGTFGMPPEPMPCPPGVEPGELEIGHGNGEFVPLDTGPAMLVHGRQGGFHIVLGVRAPGLDTIAAGTANLRGTIDGVVLADHPFVANLTCGDESVGAQALWINLILESTPAELHEKTVDIEVEIVDTAGASVSATASVMIVDPLAPG